MAPKTRSDTSEPLLHRRRARYTLNQKLDVLTRINEGRTVRDVATELQMPVDTVRGMIRRRSHILSFNSVSTSHQENRFRAVRPIIVKLESLLRTWIYDTRAKGYPLSGHMIRSKAESLHDDMMAQCDGGACGEPKFCASRGWFDKFKRRLGIKSRSLIGESASANEAEAKKFLEDFRDIVSEEGYDPRQVWNVDETALYWKKFPKRSFVTKEEKNVPGFKANKQRLTLLVGGNAFGDKLKPMLIHNAKTPRAMRKVNKENLPVHWYHSKKGWMTTSLFKNWFEEHLVPNIEAYNRTQNLDNKAILVLDNASAHAQDVAEKHPHIRVTFLPPNTTSVLQPMDQGAIAAFKSYYLRKTMNSAIASFNGNNQSITTFWRNFSIKDAVETIGESWDEVKQSTMNGVWRRLWPDCVAEGNTNGGTSPGDVQFLNFSLFCRVNEPLNTITELLHI